MCRAFASRRTGVNAEELTLQLSDFFLQRVRTLLQDGQGIDYDLINAVFGEDADYQARALRDLLDVRDRAQFLQTIRNDGRLARVYETVNRAAKLAVQGDLETDVLDPTGLVEARSLFVSNHTDNKPSKQSLQKAAFDRQTESGQGPGGL